MRNEILFTAPRHLQRDGERIEGLIIKLPEPIIDTDPGHLRDDLRPRYLRGTPDPRGKTSILAIVMPEEHTRRDPSGQGWLFIHSEKGIGHAFIRAGRAGDTDLRARTPELTPLADKTVAVFGLGCIGSTSSIELAKAGIKELRLLDHDTIDPGTIVRYPLGLPKAGLPKAQVLQQFIAAQYPLTQTTGIKHAIGRFGNDHDALATMTEGCSLIYDATAEWGITFFLAELARRTSIPFVHASSTPGGWGGNIIRLTEQTGCWSCYRAAVQRHHDHLENGIPDAPADTTGNVQPAGCGDPTFTGTGFDMATIALAGVRTTVATLSAAYPSQDWDVMVVSLRDGEGRLIAPRYDTFSLPKDPSCPTCGSA